MTAASLDPCRPREPDRTAAERLIRAHGGRSYAAAQRLLGCPEAAMAAVADACRALLAGPRAVDPAAQLHRQTLAAALRRLPERPPHAGAPIEALLPEFMPDGHRRDPGAAWDAATEQMLRSRAGGRQVLALIDRLPDEHRILLLLADVEGLGLPAGAAMLGIDLEVAGRRLHRARQALRELLAAALRGRREP